MQEWNLQVQQQIDHATSLNVAYVHTESDHLMTWLNANAPVLGGTGAGFYANRNTIDEGVAGGEPQCSGLQVFLNRQMAAGLQATVAYTWSHTLDNSNCAFSTGVSGAGSRIFIVNGLPDLAANYGNSDQDQRNVFVGSAVYQLPMGRGKMVGHDMNRIFDTAFGGWQLNVAVNLASGTPIDLNTGGTPDN